MAQVDNLTVYGNTIFLNNIIMPGVIDTKVASITTSTSTGWANTYYGILNVTQLFGKNISFVLNVCGFGNRTGMGFSVVDATPSNYKIAIFTCGGSGTFNAQVTAKFAE